jgi:rRNA processing protein Krr1/Pno1
VDKIERALRARLQERQQGTVRLIIRVTGDMAQATARLAERQVTVLRSFRLINAVAVSCSAETALALLQEPWVQAVEEDRQVFVQPADGKARKQRRRR